MGELIVYKIRQRTEITRVIQKKKTVGEVAQRSSCGGESTVYLRNDNVKVLVWA